MPTGEELTRERVLGCAVRLLDVGMFRIGSEEYADEDGGLGLATLRREHVSVQDEAIVFEYPAKGGMHRAQVITDPVSRDVISTLARRRSGRPELLAYRERSHWSPIRSEDINQYLKTWLGDEFSAKDFRTWNATVLAAVSLAIDGAAGKHPRGGPALVYRPQGVRSLPGRDDDRGHRPADTRPRPGRRSGPSSDRARGRGSSRRSPAAQSRHTVKSGIIAREEAKSPPPS